VTDTIVLTTTYCPGNPTPTPSAIATPSAPAQTTLTIYTTTVYTITSCAPTITNCPAKLGAVTTDTIIAYTTVCPIEEAISKGLITAPAGIPTSTSTAYKSLTVVNLITQTVLPVPYTPSPYVPSVNSTGVAAGSTALTYSASPSPSSSPVEYKGGASGVLAGKGSGLAMVIVFVGAAVFL
jgi:chitinase